MWLKTVVIALGDGVVATMYLPSAWSVWPLGAYRFPETGQLGAGCGILGKHPILPFL